MITELKPKLVSRLSESLPGFPAFSKLSPIPVKDYRLPTENYRSAGVVSLIYPKENQAHLLFMKRTSNHPQDKHAGQISFPGGQKDPVDIDMKACAIRECWEEVGVPEESYNILGSLSQLYVSVSNFLIHPYLAIADKPLDFTLEVNEVSDIIEFPLAKLLDYKMLDTTEIQVRGYKMKNVPYFDLDGEILWGATSMITSEIIQILMDLNVKPQDLKY